MNGDYRRYDSKYPLGNCVILTKKLFKLLNLSLRRDFDSQFFTKVSGTYIAAEKLDSSSAPNSFIPWLPLSEILGDNYELCLSTPLLSLFLAEIRKNVGGKNQKILFF